MKRNESHHEVPGARALILFLSVGLCLLASCAAPGTDSTESSGEFSIADQLLAGALETGEGGEADCCATKEGEEAGEPAAEIALPVPTKMNIPDLELIDQTGKKVRFYSDVVQGRVVAMNFIFTTCTTICPPLTATFAKVQQLTGERSGKDFHLITVSVDPVNDTPERMRAWGLKFGARPGWTLLTGTKHNVDTLLKALGVFTPLKEDHSPLVLVGNEPKSLWTRINGLAPPEQIVKTIEGMIDGAREETPAEAATPVTTESPAETPTKTPETPAAAAAPAAISTVSTALAAPGPSAPENPQARKYFTDVELVNQHGETMRLYSDVIRGKVVVIDCFFTSCTGVCPILSKNFLAIQDALEDRLGKDFYLVSISVDPLTDTVPKLKEYAEKNHARPGWYFLSGKKENVDQALLKLGYYVADREQHSNVVLIGNDRTGLWKKAFGLSTADKLVPIVRSVLDDVDA